MYSFDYLFDKIFVLKSLGETDTTADDLYYNTILPCSDKTGLANELIELYDVSDWTKAVQTICQDNKHHPLVHFEMHGSEEDGLQLRLGDYIPWSQVVDDLRKINIRSKMNLIITMATCYSTLTAFNIKMLNNPAPYLFSITTHETISPEITYSMFSLFFEELINSGDLFKALKYVEVKRPDTPSHFNPLAVPYLFENTWKRVIDRYKNEESMIKEFYHSFPDFQDRELTRKEFEWYKNGFAKECNSNLINEFYRKSRDVFFMFDKYPQNRNRFILAERIC